MIVVTGGTGRLGRALRSTFPSAQFPARDELDLRNETSVARYLTQNPPSVVIHAAAMTDVRHSELDRELCWDVNVRGTERLVRTLQDSAHDCRFVFVSTACVFHGDHGEYTEDDVPYPKNFYGLSKLVGEYIAAQMRSHLIIRTNFVAREPWPFPRAFVDRFGTYLFADDVARAIRQLVNEGRGGLVHVAGDTRMSMLELARLTTPDVSAMTMSDVNLPLTVDMTLRSVRIAPYRITRPDKP